MVINVWKSRGLKGIILRKSIETIRRKITGILKKSRKKSDPYVVRGFRKIRISMISLILRLLKKNLIKKMKIEKHMELKWIKTAKK